MTRIIIKKLGYYEIELETPEESLNLATVWLRDLIRDIDSILNSVHKKSFIDKGVKK